MHRTELKLCLSFCLSSKITRLLEVGALICWGDPETRTPGRCCEYCIVVTDPVSSFISRRRTRRASLSFHVAALGLGVVVAATACGSEEPTVGEGTGGQSSPSGGAGGGPSSGSGGTLGGGGSLPSGGNTSSSGGSVSDGAGGSGEVTISDAFVVEVVLASEVDSQAPTTVGIVTWSLPGETVTDARLEFGLDATYGMVAPVDVAAEDFRTLLLGMKPMKEYHFRVVATTAAGSLASQDFTVTTGADNSGIELSSFDIQVAANREPGFIVTSFWRGDTSSVIFVLDQDGEIVWWYDTGMDGVARARMSEDGQTMWMIEPNNQGAALARVSMDTLDAESFPEIIGSHDLTPVSGSTMAFLEYGESDCNSIFEIDPLGVTKEVWDSEERASAMCHGNALRYSQKEDVYTYSDVSTDIWIISRSGEFQWSLADKVEGGVASWGGTNHGHHLLDDSLILFANRGGGNMLSTVVEYDLEGNELFEYDGGEFSANLGDVQRLPGGNTLVTYSNNGVIHEITPDKQLVLEITTAGQSFGYALWRESLYGAPPDLGL